MPDRPGSNTKANKVGDCQERTRSRFLLGLVLLFLAFLASVWMAQRTLEMSFRVRHTQELLTLIQDTLTDLVDLETGYRGYSLTKQQSFLEPYSESKRRLSEDLGKLESFVQGDNSQLSLLLELKTEVKLKVDFADQVVRAVSSIGDGAAAKEISIGKGKVLMDQIRATLQQMRKLEESRLNRRTVRLQRELSLLFFLLLLFAAASIAVLTWSYQTLKRESLLRYHLKENYRRLLDSSPDATFVLDEIGTMLLVSHRCTSFFGYSTSELVGRNFETLLPERFRGKHRQAQAAFIERWRNHAEAESAIEIIGLRKDRSEFPGEVTLSPILGPDGFTVVCAVRDITERKLQQAKLKMKSDELERSNQELEQFAYVASHDLQEPLRMITSYLKLLDKRSHDELDITAREFLAYALDGARRLREMIVSLLAYSRAGNERFPLTPVDCKAIFHRVMINLDDVVKETGAQVRVGSLPTLITSGPCLERVFQNLLGNALKYRSTHPPKVEVMAERRETSWVFSVRDNGLGIPQDSMPRIFQLFQRFHGSDVAGTGIGLATSKRMVERLGGRMWVSSTPEAGSTFYFSLPDDGPSAANHSRGFGLSVVS